MQENDEEYHELCAEIAKEIVASYKEKTGTELTVNSLPYESTIDLCPSGDRSDEIIYVTFYKPGHVNFSFIGSGSVRSESYCLADPLFFAKTTKHLQRMAKWLEAKKENTEAVLNALKSIREKALESQPQP